MPADEYDARVAVRGSLAWLIHTSIEAPTPRRVRARSLQARTSPVGRVPSSGVWECELFGLAIKPSPPSDPPVDPEGGGADEEEAVVVVLAASSIKPTA